MDTDGKFYLGKIFDPKANQLTEQPLLYDPADLTTHAVVVGMTGSGKTGLCIGMLEEAALAGVPALMIDPKGDITNMLLHFPQLAPQDFQPWINADDARRERKTIEQAATEAAAMWRKGLTDWGIGPDRLLALKNAAHFAIYTPGSDAGIPVSILASLEAPPIPWESNRELLREKISGTVTAILGLVGLDNIDPVRSREHILLSNIFENAWSQGKDLDLSELILQTQNPPFPRLGVFDVNTFFPEKDRFELAMLLNNILASPAFQTWIEGQPLDIEALLYAPDGRPRHSIFYIAHLSDSERMFFVTLLYSAIETWMRSKPGTTSLRALVYFDEIFGYLPPIGNPPSKMPILRMLKQARAFGIGQVLVTQNPVDLDYKALSNAGCWFIGKLQTDQDKQRLLDGLESALAGGLDRQAYDRLLSTLAKRVFLLNNVHDKQPVLFQTRWAMNYLAGPLTSTQLDELNKLAGASLEPEPTTPEPSSPIPTAGPIKQPGLDTFQAIPVAPPKPSVQVNIPAERPAGSTTRPAVQAGIQEYFLPNNVTFTQAFREAAQPLPPDASSQGLLYRPVLLGQANVRFFNPKYNLNYNLIKTSLVTSPDRRGMVRWEEYPSQPVDPDALDRDGAPQARYEVVDAPFSDVRTMKLLEKDFLEWVFRNALATVRVHPTLKLYAGPDVSPAEFRTRVAEAAREGRDAEVKKVSSAYEKRLEVLRTRLAREQRALDENEEELSQRRMEEFGTHAENLISLLGGRRSRRLSTSLTKRRLTAETKSDVESGRKAIDELEKEIKALEQEQDNALADIQERWGKLASEITETTVAPLKKDVMLEIFGLAWMPYHVVKAGVDTIELPGFKAELTQRS